MYNIITLASDLTNSILEHNFAYMRASGIDFTKVFSPMTIESDDSGFLKRTQIAKNSQYELINRIYRSRQSLSDHPDYLSASTYRQEDLSMKFDYEHLAITDANMDFLGNMPSEKTILDSLRQKDLTVFRGGCLQDLPILNKIFYQSLLDEFGYDSNKIDFMNYFLQGDGHLLLESLSADYFAKRVLSLDHLFSERCVITKKEIGQMKNGFNPDDLEQKLKLHTECEDVSFKDFLSNFKNTRVGVLFDSYFNMVREYVNPYFNLDEQIKMRAVRSNFFGNELDKRYLFTGNKIFKNCNLSFSVHNYFEDEMHPRFVDGHRIIYPNTELEKKQYKHNIAYPTLEELSGTSKSLLLHLKDGMSINIVFKNKEFDGAYIFNPHLREVEAYFGGKKLSNLDNKKFIDLDLNPFEMNVSGIN